ncbi:monoacylglycerol lipase ABHD12 [Austrofundulus limnaeus]|uniref:Monoacylglycerol lipase ABHD12-like n=1 Tax=Austrofundulus limnaeus TaxID=52670 RepID=A0A2I4C5T5_AUSLI|nr:PREDICTED: monoacylglycerol lipase ABHD12-like [Austrofundulus limnaeus]XP_013875340.1 PREDICTED: monoacylglycerol lipase ABHD12-like [Austrofundulus limnaeus]XP_013875342.1 PREDICTED: monoacylglycerol lipase ABHD12-like [Austrofundulus limnaeus]
MKRRVVKQSNPSFDGRETRRTAKKQGAPSRPWVRWALLAAAVCVLVPVAVFWLPDLIQHYIFVYRVRVPFFMDLSRPEDFSQNHTINLYLTPEEGISLGVWHTVPEHRWKEAQGKDLSWYQNTLNDGSPVFIYFHGNTNTRAAPHRVGVAKLLSSLGYHVLVPDYRGFGDSTGEPTMSGLVSDAVYLYNWVKARSGDSLVVIWGHSLGTGVSTNTAAHLVDQGVVFDGVILEGAFNTDRQPMPINPFFWYYWKFPGMGVLFPVPWAENKFEFSTEQLLKKMKSPILFLHSEDDHLVPIEVARQTYEVAAKAQSKDRVQLVTFDGSKGYLHNGLYRDPKLPDVLRNFVQSLLQRRNL